MEKHGFIVMMPGLDPKNYRVDFQGRNLNTYIGVDNMEQAEMVAKAMVKDGYLGIDLCGAFDQEKAERLSAATGKKNFFSYVTFTGREADKLAAESDWSHFGLLYFDEQVGQIRTFEVGEGTDFHTTVKVVNSLAMAFGAARDLIMEGVTFIEANRWFDDGKTAALVNAVNCSVPIGTAGRNRV